MMTTRSRWPGTVRGGPWLFLLGLVVALGPGAQASDAVSGTWQGSYECAQGHTALTLVLDAVGGQGGVQGVFYFHASPGNRGVPDGCFAMRGTFEPSNRTMKLFAGRWLLQPFGFVTVDLDGQLAPGGDRLGGQVIGPLCTSFELRRIMQGGEPVPPSCRAADAIATR